MSERLPDNLAHLYEAFSPEVIDSIGTGHTFEVDGVEFVCKYQPNSTADRFYIVKSKELIERYRRVCEEVRGGVIFELGIAEGGSTALMALWAQPRRLVAIDLEPQPLGALAEFIARRGLDGAVRPHYGVDQADRPRLQQIVADELPAQPIDVVFDDCSHDLALTRASFDALFPFVAPGGRYVIEDWNNDIIFRDAMLSAFRDTSSPAHDELMAALREALTTPAPAAPPKPLARLALELVLAAASSPEVLASVTVDQQWITVRRGSAEIDPATFRLADLYHDHYAQLGPL